MVVQEGWSDGTDEGSRDGSIVGTDDGWSDVTDEGSRDGNIVGTNDG